MSSSLYYFLALVSFVSALTLYVIPDGMNITDCPSEARHDHCKHLSDYIRNRDFNDTIMIFLSGIHSLPGVLSVTGSRNITLLTRGYHQKSVLLCTAPDSGLVFINSGDITINDIQFISCGARINNITTSILFEYSDNIMLRNISVMHGTGYGINAYMCSGQVLIQHSILHDNGNNTSKGGNLWIMFNSNPYYENTSLTIEFSNFTKGKNCFLSSECHASGIVVVAFTQIIIRFDHVKTSNNLGGNIELDVYSNSWMIEIYSSVIANATGFKGAGLYFKSSEYDNHVPQKQIECERVNQTNLLRVEKSNLTNNTAIETVGGVDINLFHSFCTERRIEIIDCFIKQNVAWHKIQGGAMKIFQHILPSFYEQLLLIDNISLVRTNFIANSGQASIIELVNIKKMDIINSSFTANNGTAISAKSTNIIFSGNILFLGNAGINGGALRLCDSSFLFINKDTTVTFESNHASQVGGAIYVQQSCLDKDTACFFQPIVNGITDISDLKTNGHMEVKFDNNKAEIAGDDIYGGIIDQCIIYSKFERVNSGQPSYNLSSAIFDEIFHISNEKCTSSNSVISSDPNEVKFCNNDLFSKNITVIPGKIFNMSVYAVGQRCGVAPASITAILTQGNNSSLHILNDLAISVKGCKNVSLMLQTNNIEDEVELMLMIVTTNREKYNKLRSRMIHVSFQKCPWGFQLRDGKCRCYQNHDNYSVHCDIESEILTTKISSWIGCPINSRKNSSCTNQTEVLYAENCGRLEYCLSTEIIGVNSFNVDVQCQTNRVGIACGSCKEGYSLRFGTTRCKECSNIYLGLIIVYLGVGILLIIILTKFNITASNGAINGLIFYANLVHANREAFFVPFGTRGVLSSVIAWLNIDLGIYVCFYNGMNAYQKIWLELGYICYMWGLQITVIILCQRYILITRLFGENITKVLSTLILLLYFKVVRIIIDILQPTRLINLTYMNKSTTVLSIDGSIEFGSPKHIPLVVIALVLSIVMILFTLCLLFNQVLIKISSFKCFKWVSRLQPFFETFTGPFNHNFIFWPGLRFVMRLMLSFLIITFTERKYILYGTSFIGFFCIICSFLSPKGIYKKWSLNILDLFLMANLTIASLILAYYPRKKIVSTYVHLSSVISALFFYLTFIVYDRSDKIKKLIMIMKVIISRLNKKEILPNLETATQSSLSVSSLTTEENSPLLPSQVLSPVINYRQFREPLMENNSK